MIVWFFHAKVGHCQTPILSPRQMSGAFTLYCFGLANIITLYGGGVVEWGNIPDDPVAEGWVLLMWEEAAPELK